MEQKDQSLSASDNQPVFSLSELSQAIKRAVESFDVIRVRAEIAECRQWSSGHIYFKLKDENNILEAVIWKTMVPRMAMLPEDGLDVVITGKLTTFSRQSRYQIVVQSLELAGEGAFLKQLEERRKRLLSEGLFDAANKKPLPAMPKVIGVVTSPKGAVIRDILHRLSDRFPVHVLVWPVLVQGDAAAAEITAAIKGFNALPMDGDIPRPDVLIVARGGGSLEDLMAFNDEAVVRAVAASDIPLISAVGHETDTTLCDYAADLRAPTPTAAAELATPVRNDLRRQLTEWELRLDRKTDQINSQQAERLNALERALGDPREAIAFRQQRLDASDADHMRVIDGHLNGLSHRIQGLADRLPTPAGQIADARDRAGQIMLRLDQAQDRLLSHQVQRLGRITEGITAPTGMLEQKRHHLTLLEGRILRRGEQILERLDAKLDQVGRLLEASSYQKVLARGFALISDADDGRILKSAKDAASRHMVNLRFADGRLEAQITGTDQPPGQGGGKPLGKKAPKNKETNTPDDSDQANLFSS
jgi:exodeoxyribonuclease VII large subunit